MKLDSQGRVTDGYPVISLAFREPFAGVCLFLGADTSTFPREQMQRSSQVCANSQTSCLAEDGMAEFGRAKRIEKRWRRG